ncbi:MAG: hypothetical protein EOP84_24625 [Verrucomicrobiaceae bacterium]|nr:MAG: hypothetical protein EOP84_24625 [Verrucomicrobiaceae bacterium]
MIRGLHSKLSDAMAGGELVRAEREVATGWTYGYVVALGRQWCVLLVVGGGITFDGYKAIRLKDVAALTVPTPYAAFIEKALKKRKLRRPMSVVLDLSSTAELLHSANVHYPLVTVHRETVDPDVCHIGRVISTSRTSVTLHEIGPAATWDEELLSYPLSEITCITFGGLYEDALWLVGGPKERALRSVSHLGCE